MAHSDDPLLPPDLDDISPREEGSGVPPGAESAPALSDGEARNLFGLAAEGCLPVSVHEGDKAGDRFGPFLLLETLGEGGFGIVWLAEQCEPIRRTVALKVIKPEMHSRDILARFERERQALALMDHPNIAAVLDAGQTASGRPWFSMERVAGMPITDYCDVERLGLRGRVELFLPICRAVQHAHQKGVLHRDLKPSNLLVERVDGHAVPKIIDFGIAKALQTATMDAPGLSLLWTQGVLLVGTPLYMSPEQAGFAGLDVDSRSDIYSLGAVLHELLAGTAPLSREALASAPFDEVLRIVREKEPSSLHRSLHSLDAASRETVAMRRRTDSRRLHSQLKGDLEWIVLKALEKDRERRYESAAALAQDLENYLHGDPVTAGPPGAAYRLGKVARRHRGPLVAGGLVLASLVVGLGLAIGQAARAMRAERIAESRLDSAEKARDAAEELVNEGIYGMRSKLLAFGKVELMEDMVDAADAYYRGLPDELLQNDETQRHLAGLALNRAMIALSLGRDEEHERHTRECLALLEALLERNPDAESLHDEACYAMLGLCQLHVERGDQSALVEMIDTVVGRCQEWLDRHPETLWAMHYQVLAHNMAAQTLVRELNRPLEGEERFETAISIARRMREVHGDDPRVLECEGYMHAGKGKIAETLKQWDLAQAEHEAAMTAFGKALELGGGSSLLREQHLSSTYRTGGMVRRNATRDGNEDEMRRGEALMLAALEGRKELVALEPGRAEWWRDLAHSHRQFVSLATERKDLDTALSHLREEIRCRDEAVARSPHRPLLLAERAVSNFNLGDALARKPDPDPAAAVGAILSGFEDHCAAIVQNGGAPILASVAVKPPSENLARLAESHLAEGKIWLRRAIAILEPFAGKMPGSDLDNALGILAVARDNNLAALDRRDEAQTREAELAKRAGGSTDPAAMHDRVHGLVFGLYSEAFRLRQLAPEDRKAAADRLDAALKEVDPLLDAILAKEPANPVYLETLSRRLCAQGFAAWSQGQRDEAMDAFVRGLERLRDDPSTETMRFEAISAHFDILREEARENGRHEEVRSKAEEFAAFVRGICERKAPPPSVWHFHSLGDILGAKADAEVAMGDWDRAIVSSTESVEALARAKERNPGESLSSWAWLSRTARLAEVLMMAGEVDKSLERMPEILSQAQSLASREEDPVHIRKFADERLSTCAGRLRDTGRLAEAAQAMRTLLALRERLDALGSPTEDLSRSTIATRILLLGILSGQKRTLEMEEELAVVGEAIAKIEAPLERAETHARLAEFLNASAARPADGAREARAALGLAQMHGLGWRRISYSRILATSLSRMGESEDAWKTLTESWEEASSQTWPDETYGLRGSLVGSALNLIHSRHMENPAPVHAEETRLWMERISTHGNLTSQKKSPNFTQDLHLWRTLLAHLAETGRIDEYRESRRHLLAASQLQSASMYLHANTVLATLALPLGDEEETRAIGIAERSLAGKSTDGWSLLAVALARVRAGRPEEAHAVLAPTSTSSYYGIQLLGQAIAALAFEQAGEPAKAAALLESLRNPSASNAGFLTSPSHRDAILARLLLRETGWSAPSVP